MDIPFYCVICGHLILWDDSNEPPNPWGGGTYYAPSHSICECCGCEFGYHDQSYHPVQLMQDVEVVTARIKEYRQQWLSNTLDWQHFEHSTYRKDGTTTSIFFRFIPPAGWSLTEQMKNIPAAFQPKADELTPERLQHIPPQLH